MTQDDLERIAQLAAKVAKLREHYVHRQEYLVERREAEADFEREVSPEVVGELIRGYRLHLRDIAAAGFEQVCNEKNQYLLFCTLPPKHDGPHIATDVDGQELDRWEEPRS